VRRLIAIALLAVAGCVLPAPPSEDIHVIIVACETDAHQFYAEITLFTGGWYRAVYFDGQTTEWKYYYAYETLASVHAGGFHMEYSLEDPRRPGEDDAIIQPEGGYFYGPSGGPLCSNRV
jgi:hypothetical protein